MYVRYICGCGGENYCLYDWIAHWKYGQKRYDKGFLGRHPKLRAVWLFLQTRIEIKKG